MWKTITLKYFKESIRDYPYATGVKKKKKEDLLSKITKYNTNHSNLKQSNQSKLKTPSHFWLSHVKKNIRGTHVHIWIISMIHCERPGDLTYTYIVVGIFFFFGPTMPLVRSVSWRGTEPRPWKWKHWIQTTRPPGNSQGIINFF